MDIEPPVVGSAGNRLLASRPRPVSRAFANNGPLPSGIVFWVCFGGVGCKRESRRRPPVEPSATAQRHAPADKWDRPLVRSDCSEQSNPVVGLLYDPNQSARFGGAPRLGPLGNSHRSWREPPPRPPEDWIDVSRAARSGLSSPPPTCLALIEPDEKRLSGSERSRRDAPRGKQQAGRLPIRVARPRRMAWRIKQ